MLNAQVVPQDTSCNPLLTLASRNVQEDIMETQRLTLVANAIHHAHIASVMVILNAQLAAQDTISNPPLQPAPLLALLVILLASLQTPAYHQLSLLVIVAVARIR